MGNGCFDLVDYEDESTSDYRHQYYNLHLNYKSSSDKWTIGHYLFLNTIYEEAIELFMLDDSDFTTAIKVYNPYNPAVLEQLALDLNKDYIKKALGVCPNLVIASEKRQD